MPRRIASRSDACRRHLCRSCCTWNWCNWSYCYGWCWNGTSQSLLYLLSFSLTIKGSFSAQFGPYNASTNLKCLLPDVGLTPIRRRNTCITRAPTFLYTKMEEIRNQTLSVVVSDFSLKDTTSSWSLQPVPGVFQQTASGLATLNQDCYEFNKGCFEVYAFEYKSGWVTAHLPRTRAHSPFLASRFDDGYISWVNAGELSWTLRGLAMGPDTATEIGTRPISQEPMVLSSVLFYQTHGSRFPAPLYST